MADLEVRPIGTLVRPVPGMTLGEMVNVARGAQTYQTEKIALTLEQQRERERNAAMDFFSRPENFQSNGRIDIDKINAELPKIAPLTAGDYISKFTTLGNAQTQAIAAKQNLTKDQRSMIGQRFAILGRLGVQDKEAYIKEMDLMKAENPDNPDFGRLLDAYKVTWRDIQSGPQLPAMAIQGAQTLLSPTEQETVFAPKVEVTAGGQTVTTQRMPGTAPTKTEIGIAGGLQAPVTGPAAPAAAAGQPRALPYPVRSAMQPFIPEPGEVADRAAGQAYRDKIVSAQTNLATNRRNVEEVIGKAKQIGGGLYFEEGGIPGAIERRIRMAISSEDYDMLAKDLANMALSNSQALGSVGNTVAGLDMQAVANGTIKVPPNVLIQIARRVQADQTNLNMQANGAQKFAERFGDNNMKRFQQNWNDNADTKIFEVMNIFRDETDPTKRQQQIDKLLGKDPAKRKEFFDKYNNLKKLSETGSL